MALDIQIAIASGLPPIIECKAFVVKKPGWQGGMTRAAGRVLTDDRGKTIAQIFVECRYAFYDHMSEILRLVNAQAISATDVDNLLRLIAVIRREVDTAKDQVAATLQYRQQLVAQLDPLSSASTQVAVENSTELASFATMVLTMLAAKPYAIIYGPLRQQFFLPYLQSQDPRYVAAAFPDVLNVKY